MYQHEAGVWGGRNECGHNEEVTMKDRDLNPTLSLVIEAKEEPAVDVGRGGLAGLWKEGVLYSSQRSCLKKERGSVCHMRL